MRERSAGRSVAPRAAAAALLPLLALACPGPAHAAWQVWVERATVKVLPDRAPGPRHEARIEAARGEAEGFQVVVRDPQLPLAGVDLALGPLLGPDGATVPLERTHAYRELLVPISDPSDCLLQIDCAGVPPEYARLPGRYPDPLVPLDDPYSAAHPPVGAPFAVEAATSQALFVDVRVPRDAPAGTYTGQLTVRADGQPDVALPVTLEVWDFDQPSPRRVATAFGFSAGSIRRYHGGPAGPGPEDEARLLRNYEVALHEHHLDTTYVGGPVDFRFDDAGLLLAPDWTAYDAAVAPRLDGSYWPDGQPPVRFSPGRFEPGSGRGGMSDDQWAQAAAALATHLQQRGWLPRAFLYSADEPFIHRDAFTTIPTDVALLATHTDLWRGHVLVTNPLDPRLVGAVDIWCPVTPMFEDWFWTPPGNMPGREEYAARRALGEELWFYVCNANFPPFAGYDVDSVLGHEPRVVKWGAWYEGASGFLYWSTTFWQDPDPWTTLADHATFEERFARNGDGILIYPGDHDGTAAGAGSPADVAIDGPVLSYRLKMVRDGLEDWELFLLATDLGAEAYVRSQVEQVYRQFGVQLIEGIYDPAHPPWTVDDEPLHQARHQIAAKVLHLLHPDAYPDPEQPAPPQPGEDGGVAQDGGVIADAGVMTDAGAPPDAARPVDAAVATDATPRPATSATGGEDGCGCSSSPVSTAGAGAGGGVGALLALWLARHR